MTLQSNAHRGPDLLAPLLTIVATVIGFLLALFILAMVVLFNTDRTSATVLIAPTAVSTPPTAPVAPAAPVAPIAP